MTTHHVRDPTVIHFTIDGRHGILGARHIAEIQHHLGILLPPEHDMPSPSKLIDPSQEAPPVEQIVHRLHTILPPLTDHLSTFCIYLL
ncbi:hypothetical protein AAG906_038343 [Vitis piasezkii]